MATRASGSGQGPDCHVGPGGSTGQGGVLPDATQSNAKAPAVPGTRHRGAGAGRDGNPAPHSQVSVEPCHPCLGTSSRPDPSASAGSLVSALRPSPSWPRLIWSVCSASPSNSPRSCVLTPRSAGASSCPAMRTPARASHAAAWPPPSLRWITCTSRGPRLPRGGGAAAVGRRQLMVPAWWPAVSVRDCARSPSMGRRSSDLRKRTSVDVPCAYGLLSSGCGFESHGPHRCICLVRHHVRLQEEAHLGALGQNRARRHPLGLGPGGVRTGHVAVLTRK